MVNPKPSRTFPDHFKWGFAAAAPQIEGAAFADGKGLSVRDTLARQPGRVHNGDTLDLACDHYRRYAEDLTHMARLGAKHYRLTVAWPRIYPQGTTRRTSAWRRRWAMRPSSAPRAWACMQMA